MSVWTRTFMGREPPLEANAVAPPAKQGGGLFLGWFQVRLGIESFSSLVKGVFPVGSRAQEVHMDLVFMGPFYTIHLPFIILLLPLRIHNLHPLLVPILS